MVIQSKNQFQSGFTLVELAIVMIVVGLLIGGILKGQELVQNARVADTIRMIKSIEAAAYTFKDKYAGLPGDIPAERLAGCDAANNCLGGDSNGIVGNVPHGDGIAWTSRVGTAGMRMESSQFWKHLALDGMIRGVIPSANVVSDAQFGVTHPVAPLGGGVEFYYDGLTTIGFVGHLLRFSENGIGEGAVIGSIDSAYAAKLDKKLDDSNPDTGIVFADYGVRTSSCKADEDYRPDGYCIIYVGLF